MTCECPEEIHVGDVGTQFIATIKENVLVNGVWMCKPVDISAGSNFKIIFDKPNGVGVEKTASLLTDGKDGKIQWTTTLTTDLDQDGQWKMQGKVTIGGGTWSSSIDYFRVKPNIEVP